MNAMMKFRIGDFTGWLLGRNDWVVRDRRTNEPVARARSMNEAARAAQRLYDLEKAG